MIYTDQSQSLAHSGNSFVRPGGYGARKITPLVLSQIQTAAENLTSIAAKLTHASAK
jgi:hypothetical protein